MVIYVFLIITLLFILKKQIKKAPSEYLIIDLPPIRIPYNPNSTSEDIFKKYVPRVKPRYVPPGIKLIWPEDVMILGILPLKKYEFNLPIKYKKEAINYVVWIVKRKLHKTKVYREGSYWVIDFPRVSFLL